MISDFSRISDRYFEGPRQISEERYTGSSRIQGAEQASAPRNGEEMSHRETFFYNARRWFSARISRSPPCVSYWPTTLAREKVKGKTPWWTPPWRIFLRGNSPNTREFERIFPVKTSREFPLCDGCVPPLREKRSTRLFAHLAAVPDRSDISWSEDWLAP